MLESKWRLNYSFLGICPRKNHQPSQTLLQHRIHSFFVLQWEIHWAIDEPRVVKHGCEERVSSHHLSLALSCSFLSIPKPIEIFMQHSCTGLSLWKKSLISNFYLNINIFNKNLMASTRNTKSAKWADFCRSRSSFVSKVAAVWHRPCKHKIRNLGRSCVAMRHQATHVTGNGSVETHPKSNQKYGLLIIEWVVRWVALTPPSNVNSEVLHLQGQDIENNTEFPKCWSLWWISHWPTQSPSWVSLGKGLKDQWDFVVSPRIWGSIASIYLILTWSTREKWLVEKMPYMCKM